jgi:hypothetical protein
MRAIRPVRSNSASGSLLGSRVGGYSPCTNPDRNVMLAATRRP